MALAAVAGACLASPAPRQAQTQERIRELGAQVGGVLGVSAVHLEGKTKLAINEQVAFPMASTLKIALSAYTLARVDVGELDLRQLVTVEPHKLSPSDGIASLFIHPGIRLSLANLIEAALTVSDNTATDVLFELNGGGGAVTAWLERAGIRGQRLDRDTAAAGRDFFGLPVPPGRTSLLQQFQQTFPGGEPPSQKSDTPNPAFDADPRDTSTPAAMTALLIKIWSGQLLKPQTSRFLQAVMSRCRTGAARLAGMLPAGTTLAHKTGSIGGSVNDVGVITLPGGRGHLVITVFIKQSSAPVAAREQAIARIARAAYDDMVAEIDAGH